MLRALLLATAACSARARIARGHAALAPLRANPPSLAPRRAGHSLAPRHPVAALLPPEIAAISADEVVDTALDASIAARAGAKASRFLG